MAQKLYPASNPRDDRLFDELFYRRELLEARNPVVQVETPPTPGDSFDVVHDLGRVARGYLVIRTSAPCQVYDGEDEWDQRKLSLRATAASVTIDVLVL